MILLIFLLAIPIALMGWKMCAIAGMADEQMETAMRNMQRQEQGNIPPMPTEANHPSPITAVKEGADAG